MEAVQCPIYLYIKTDPAFVYLHRSLSSEYSALGSPPFSGGGGRLRKPKRASLPRTSNAVFTFGGSREQEEVEEAAREKVSEPDRVSIVRDSIRYY